MEIKFQSETQNCLRMLTDSVQTREETKELRIPEGLPEIGRVLASWGQCTLGSKQWRSGSFGIGGEVSVWVLYAPEDGSEPRCVEGRIPYQHKWEVADNGRDGFVWVMPMLKSVDARSVSPRKLMVRVDISIRATAYQRDQEQIYCADQDQDGLCLLHRTYPMEVPVEYGEKQVELEESLSVPMGTDGRILSCCLSPCITESRLIGSRVVFRGKGIVQVVYICGGMLGQWETEVEFSQFADLDSDCAADAVLCPVTTMLAWECIEGRLQLRASLAVQYRAYARIEARVVQDAYGLNRTVEPTIQPLRLPARLEHKQMQGQIDISIQADAASVSDTRIWMDQPRYSGDGVVVSGTCQIIYYDPAGHLQTARERFETALPLEVSQTAAVCCSCINWQKADVGCSAGEIVLRVGYALDLGIYNGSGIEMVTGLELGDAYPPDPDRPTLILRRCGEESLWEIAKANATTVDAIRRANGLEGEPEKARMLLIPIA